MKNLFEKALKGAIKVDDLITVDNRQYAYKSCVSVMDENLNKCYLMVVYDKLKKKYKEILHQNE